MKRIFIKFSLFLILSMCLKACEPADDSPGNSDCPASRRTGAVCNDGTTSTATGSGACSQHGGVKYWLCN